MTISPQTKNWLRQSAALDGAVVSQTLLNLLERVEALEQRPIPGTVELAAPTPEAAPVATDEELYQLAYSMPLSTERGRRRRCYDLGRKHGTPAAQPTPPAAPAGLLARVMLAIDGSNDLEIEARAAIREVAAAARERIAPFDPSLKWGNVAQWLEQEANR